MVSKIRKRDGRIVKFEERKIKNALLKTMHEIGRINNEVAEEVSKEIVRRINAKFLKIIPNVEDVQDIVEDVLISYDLSEVAKAYILYRARHKEFRNLKSAIGLKNDELKLSMNAITVLEKRYLLRNKGGKIVETPKQMFQRVARHVASVEKGKYEKEFFEIMSNLEFLPNTPCLVNSGTRLGQLAGCFVLPIEDSIESIFDTLKNAAKIFQSGGGVGYSFSNIRARGSLINSTNRKASGSVSFMELYDKTSDVIKQGGVRRGASIGILRVDHPDILEFINAKRNDRLENFNLSIAVTDDFMHRVINNEKYDIIDHNSKKIGKLNARNVFEMICSNAWSNGEPGLIFIDEINRNNPLKKISKIESTNPCGEVPLIPYSSCVLGSINLAKMIRGDRVDWVRLDRVVRLGVRFLDDVVEINKYPLKEIEERTRENRNIGLGVMGWADMLILLGIRYDSYAALELAEKIMKFIKEKAEDESRKLGCFKNFNKSTLKKRRRNATLLAIAPTGSISLIANCSSGIEPLFGLSYVRNALNMKLFEVNKNLENYLRLRGLYSKELMIEIARKGSIQGLNLPKEIKNLFVTALDIKSEWHVKMQAVFQKYVDNSVSKTVNLEEKATVDDVKKIFFQAFRLKCKGITVYRYGSREKQALDFGENFIAVNEEYSGGCYQKECDF